MLAKAGTGRLAATSASSASLSGDSTKMTSAPALA
jgi:hypothetical protein